MTSPSQVDGPPPGAVPIDPYTDAALTAGLSHQYDPIFDRYRGAIPIEYVRALASRESDLNPRTRTGSARGLMQIVPVVLDDYNHRHGTRYEPQHLDDPAINVAICCELLRLIVAGYHRNHPHVPNLQADWSNLRFVELLTFGWNAGFSEAGGVGRVARYLEQHGTTDLTIDLVHRSTTAAGASQHLANAAKVGWCKSVAALYQRERAASVRAAQRDRESGTAARRGASWFSIKTPSVILDEMRAAKNEIEALGRDIYATYRRPFEAQKAAAEERFLQTNGRRPGIGRQADDKDFPTVRSWMRPVPSDDDWSRMSYQGQFVGQWGEFAREFSDFWAAHEGSWTDRLWRGAYDKAVEYRERAGEWRKRFEKMGGTPTTPAPKPPTETFLPSGFSIPWKAIAAIGGIAAGALILPAAIRAARHD